MEDRILGPTLTEEKRELQTKREKTEEQFGFRPDLDNTWDSDTQDRKPPPSAPPVQPESKLSPPVNPKSKLSSDDSNSGIQDLSPDVGEAFRKQGSHLTGGETDIAAAVIAHGDGDFNSDKVSPTDHGIDWCKLVDEQQTELMKKQFEERENFKNWVQSEQFLSGRSETQNPRAFVHPESVTKSVTGSEPIKSDVMRDEQNPTSSEDNGKIAKTRRTHTTFGDPFGSDSSSSSSSSSDSVHLMMMITATAKS